MALKIVTNGEKEGQGDTVYGLFTSSVPLEARKWQEPLPYPTYGTKILPPPPPCTRTALFSSL
jgi:hypothetical protein